MSLKRAGLSAVRKESQPSIKPNSNEAAIQWHKIEKKNIEEQTTSKFTIERIQNANNYSKANKQTFWQPFKLY